MNQTPKQDHCSCQSACPCARRQVRQVTAEELFGDDREVRIAHAGEEYRLTITSRGKLILTK